jgi:serine/threonine protein kinase
MIDRFDPDPQSQAARISAITQFNTEAKMLARLDHKNLPKVIDFFEDQSSYFLVMEYIEGESIKKVQEKAEPDFLPVETVITWGIQILEVLEYLHTREPHPIIFRDLKPDNIMLASDNTIKLIDFGIAKMFDPKSKTQTAIRGTGTIGFLPPEQYGEIGTEARSDIYAMGATLYVLLTNEPCPASIDRLINRTPLLPPSGFNPDVSLLLENCLFKAMELKRDNRYQTALDMKKVLEQCLHPEAYIIVTETKEKEAKEEKEEWDIFEEPDMEKFNYPVSLSTDKENNIYILDTEQVQKFDRDGNFLLSFGSKGSKNMQFTDPGGITTDKNGNIYVADTGNNRIQKFNDQGKFICKWGEMGYEDNQFLYPSSVFADDKENIYVVDTGNYAVKYFDPQGNFMKKFGLCGSEKGQLCYPTCIAMDPGDNIYIGDTGNNRIQKFDINGNFLAQWSPGENFSHITGLSVDITGYIYAVDNWNNEILKFDLTGNLINKWKPLDGNKVLRLINIWSIHIDSETNIYLIDKGNNWIKKFDSSGNYIKNIGIIE